MPQNGDTTEGEASLFVMSGVGMVGSNTSLIMGPRPHKTNLDRIDNEKGYFPGNCRWATQAEQNRNSRKTRRITFRGITLCLRQWAKEVGLSHMGLHHRLKRMSVEQALTMEKYDITPWS